MKILRSVVAACSVLTLAAWQPPTSAAQVQLRENPPVPPRDSRHDKPAFLEKLKERAATFTLAEGAREVVNLVLR